MTQHSEKIIERLGLQDDLQDEILAGILAAIYKLPLWKFPTGVHTLYVDAIRDVSEGNEDWIQLAKEACNERALTTCYEL